MDAIEDSRQVDTDGSDRRQSSPRASDWFWRPWYAKSLWALALLYWIGLYAMMLMPTDWLGSTAAGAMILLVFPLNPISVIAILGYGFLKAKVACGDWVMLPGSPQEYEDWDGREHEEAYCNPVDIRSGYLHQQYLEDLAPHPTGRGGL